MLELPIATPSLLSYGFGAVAFLAFAVYLGLAWRGGGARAGLLLFAIAASALWCAATAMFAAYGGAVPWIAQGLLDGARMGACLAFLALLLAAPRVAAVLFALALAVAVFCFVVPVFPQLHVTDARLPYALLLGMCVVGLVLAEQVFRRAPERQRWSIKPLCLGLGGAFVFDLYLYADALLLGRVDADVWAARGFAHALVIPFVALAAARNKDWTLDIAVSRSLLFHSTAFLASGLYLLIVAAAGYYVRYFGGSWGKAVQAGLIFAALLLLGLLFSSGSLRARLRVFINKNFFSYRYDYRAEWLRFTRLLSKPDGEMSSVQRSIQALADLVESPGGALWLDDGAGLFVQAGRWNMPEVPAREPADSVFARFLAKTEWVVDIDECRTQPERYPDLELPEWLARMPAAWLVVPLAAQEALLGFVVLTTPRAAVDLNWEVRDLLKTAARQAGSFLAQIQASEALLEARKFDAFNKMSAFVVHDLKNLVAQLSLMLKNAERHRHNPRFQDDMLTTVQHVTERMNRLLLQLGNAGNAEETRFPVEVGRLLERVVQEKPAARERISVEAAQGLLVLAQEQKLERVLGHLVQNACDATAEQGRVEIRARASNGSVAVEVTDTGCGMTEAFVRDRLFRPFNTTKHAGMGIGAYEASQYVKALGGRIEVESKPGSGTRMTVLLPLHEQHAARAERAREVA